MRILITGAAGFIGSNAAQHFMRRGDDVILLDNLSRAGSRANLDWLLAQGSATFIQGDVRDQSLVRQAVGAHGELDAVIHLAAQVAVTRSIADPRQDFEINAGGTLNLLEAIREGGGRPVFLYASTNKVYGALEDLPTVQAGKRYRFDPSIDGIDEQRALDLHSPYGCSKGSADQYVRDYARVFGLQTCVIRQSCIYGRRQFGIEDQGWLAWLTLCAVTGREVTLFGEGLQVRDLLEVTDLVRFYERCIETREVCTGEVFNIGGGPENSLSVLEALDLLEREIGQPIRRRVTSKRAGDQKIFISSNKKATARLDWRPEIDYQAGIRGLVAWIDPMKDQILEILHHQDR